jgi:hypothetical protein
MHYMPAMIGDDLYFNVAGFEKISFEVDGVVAERGLCFNLRGLKRTPEVLGFIDDAHAASSPAGGRFDDDGIADLGRGFERSLFALQLTGTARRDR